ncbi:MAG: 23S rRNA (uracil(1939)-C(5))-methyltransferase RlmD, partial [Comamonas sp.]
LEDNLWHLAKVKPENLLRPIEGPAWGYRDRSRLSVRYVIKKNKVLVGFHERKSRYVADMETCKILPPHVDAMLMPLRALVGSMDARETLPQIEVACGEHVTAMLLRHLEPLSQADQDRLRTFGTHNVQWWLQPKGPDTVHRMDEGGTQLSYSLPEFGITMPFKPTDFTQVNPQINRVLVGRSLRLLDAKKDERVIDWFCGLGNFTLPIATMAREVLGIEGSDTLVQRSHENYAGNNAVRSESEKLAPTTFVARNLFNMTPAMLIADGNADKWLVDPPREGAFALSQALADIHQIRIGAETPEDAEPLPPLPEGHESWNFPKRIVYVSCAPATLARDADLLVNKAGYRCVSAGVINMFPHTAHVESMAVFERA